MIYTLPVSFERAIRGEICACCSRAPFLDAGWCFQCDAPGRGVDGRVGFCVCDECFARVFLDDLESEEYQCAGFFFYGDGIRDRVCVLDSHRRKAD